MKGTFCQKLTKLKLKKLFASQRKVKFKILQGTDEFHKTLRSRKFRIIIKVKF